MKRYLALALVCTTLISSCSYADKEQHGVDVSIELEHTIELNEGDYQEMIELLSSSGLVFRPFSKETPIEWEGYRWEMIADRINGSELETDYIDERGYGYYDAEKIESLIMLRFDVTPDQIRENNDEYDSKLNMYKQSEGLGGVPPMYKMIETCIDDQTLTLIYDLYYPDGSKYLTTCTTKMDLRNNTWKYISHNCEHGLDEIFGLE